MHVRWDSGEPNAQGWGAGEDWLLTHLSDLLGGLDPGHHFETAHPAIMRAQRNHPDLRFAASRNLYHELLPTVLAQRITGGEAVRQWRALVLSVGEPAPGPFVGLRLPPTPQQLLAKPEWWFHSLGIERRRARALHAVARHARHLHEWSFLDHDACAMKLAMLPGIGEWTIGTVLGTALGSPDAVAVGDYHLKNLVASALDNRPRGDDDRMLELLEPYRGQRGRVIRLLQLDGHAPPKFGPRQRILPIARW